MPKSLSLTEVAAQFAKWRKNNPRKSAKFPETLKSAIRTISKSYKKNQIISTIGVSKSMLHKITKDNVASFVELPCSNLEFIENNIQCELVRNDGTILKLTLTEAYLENFLRNFLCYN